MINPFSGKVILHFDAEEFEFVCMGIDRNKEREGANKDLPKHINHSNSFDLWSLWDYALE